MENPTYYMNLMSNEFMEYQIKFVVVEIDDVLVYSKDEEEHEEHLRLVVEVQRSSKGGQAKLESQSKSS
jgi:hypothetical protein